MSIPSAQHFNTLAPDASVGEHVSADFRGTVVGRLLDAARTWPSRELAEADADDLRQKALEERYGSVTQRPDS